MPDSTSPRKKLRRGPPYRVQLVIDPTLAYFREVILGVRQYGFETGRLDLIDRWLEHEQSDLQTLVQRDAVQGIVAAIHDPKIEARFSKLSIPVVNVSNTMTLPRLRVVTQDDRAVGRLAAEHLWNSGCRQFAFWGQHHALYSIERLEGFRSVIKPGEGTVDVRLMSPRYGRREYHRILQWLHRQQPPLGVFAVLDAFAVLVLRAARELNWRVPEDIAVLGAGDDDFLVAFERIPLSSVRLPSLKIGYEAGAEIDRMISGGKPKPINTGLAPIGLHARQSTDTLFVGDEVVAKALRYIRSSATSSPYINDIARVAGVARTTLQKRFRSVIGRTMLEEIQRVRIDTAKDLLRSGDLSLEMISERCGFSNSQRFSVVFRQHTGMPPNRFRRSTH